MIRDVLLFLTVIGVATGARSFLPPDATVTGSGATLAFGFLLLTAFFTGRIFHAVRLPHLTGFILCGAVLGPEVLSILTPGMLDDLTLVKRVAVSLIALMAGCELNLRALRSKAREIGAQAIGGLLVAALGLFVFLYHALPWLPWTADLPGFQRAAVALVVANVLCALSPAVVMGILSETRAAGPLSETALSIVVLADLFIVLTFAASSAVADAAFGGSGGSETVAGLATHLGGSALAGLLLGGALTLFELRVGRRTGLFVFAALFVVAEAGVQLHLDPLLVGLTAGLFVENASPVSGHHLIRETEPAARPVFAVFFAVIGAEVHLKAFLAVSGFAVGAAIVRALGIYVGARLGARAVSVPPTLARLVPFGMFPQAGIALALANLLAGSPHPWARGMATLVFGTILVNELVGPVLFRNALARAGEVGAKDPATLSDDEPTAEAG